MKSIFPFKRVAIAGVGLIGGSIGMAIKKYSRGAVITGIGRNIKRLKKAKSLGAVDKISLDLSAVKGHDLVVLGHPVNVIKNILGEISGFLDEDTVIIDVGSTKEGIIETAHRNLPPGVNFIGTHPLAGSEKTGITAAGAKLFQGAKCIVVKDRNTDACSLKRITRAFEILGSEVITMSSKKHDELTAVISHLPHLVAQALVGTAAKKGRPTLKLASSGFRDTTRIAGSSPELWMDIFLENKSNILDAAKKYKKEFEKICRLISENRKKELFYYLAKIKRMRDIL